MQKNRGFTLIELMVTIAVIAIIAMIAAPSLQETIDKRKIEQTATEFEKALAQSRSDAVLNRQIITIHLGTLGKDTPTDRYWSIPEDTTLSFSEGVCENNGSWANKTITALSAIQFLPQGNLKALPANLEIKLERENVERFIYLTNFGRVSSNAHSTFEGSCS